MHNRTICICCSSVKRAARCGVFGSKDLSIFERGPSRYQSRRSTFYFHPLRQKGTATTHNASGSVSPLDDINILDHELLELQGIKHEDAKDIFIDDLWATLEAHRATNRATVVRKLNQKADWKPPFKDPSVGFQNAVADGPDNDVSALVKQESATTKPSTACKAIRASGADAVEANDRGLEALEADNGMQSRPRKKQDAALYRHTKRDLHWPADSTQNEQYFGMKHTASSSEVLEYEAMYISPRGGYWSKSKSQNHPWLAGLGTYYTAKKLRSASLRLHDEIKAYENFISLSPAEGEAAELLTTDVKSIVGKEYPDKPLKAVGSYSTGLADRLSDFDFTLSFPELQKSPFQRGPSTTRPVARKAGLKALVNIRLALQRSGHFEKVEIIHARVPIVKTVHHETQLRVEIQTFASHEATREYTLYYLAEFPTLRPLYTLFRSALHLRQLNVVHEGGLGSYSIFMMIVNALKHASGQYAEDDLVGHFLHILDFYTNADLYKYGYSPDPPRVFQKRDNKMSADEKIARLQDPVLRGIDIMRKFDAKKPYMLCLQDPANPVNDLGSKAYGIKHIQRLFVETRKALNINMKAWEGDGRFQEPWHAPGLLVPFLAANYSKLEEKRGKIETWVLGSRSVLQDDSSIIDGQNHLQGFHRHAIPPTVSAASVVRIESEDVAPGEPDPAVEESASGELRVIMRDYSQMENTANTDQAPVKLDTESNAEPNLKHAVYVNPALGNGRVTEPAESSSKAEPTESAEIETDQLSADTLNTIKSGQHDIMPSGRQKWSAKNENRWKRWAPSRSTIVSETTSSHSAETVNRKNLHVDFRSSQETSLRHMDLSGFPVHESTRGHGQRAREPKSPQRLKKANIKRSRKLRESNSDFQQRLLVEQSKIMEKTRSSDTISGVKMASIEREVPGRVTSSLGGVVRKISTERKALETTKNFGEDPFQRFNDALCALASDPDGRHRLLREVAGGDRKLVTGEYLKLERREIEPGERLENPYDRFRLVKWKKSEELKNAIQKVRSTGSPIIRFSPSQATAFQERRLSLFDEQPDGTENLQEEGSIDGEERLRRLQSKYSQGKQTLSHAKKTTQSSPEATEAAEAKQSKRISPRRVRKTCPLSFRKERVSHKPGVRKYAQTRQQRMGPSYEKLALPFMNSSRCGRFSKNLFRIHGAADKPHPLHEVKTKVIEDIGKELGWKKFNEDEAVVGPNPTISPAPQLEFVKQNSKPQPEELQLPTSSRPSISKYQSENRSASEGPRIRFPTVRTQLDVPNNTTPPTFTPTPPSPGQPDEDWALSLNPPLSSSPSPSPPEQISSALYKKYKKLKRAEKKGVEYALKKKRRQQRVALRKKQQQGELGDRQEGRRDQSRKKKQQKKETRMERQQREKKEIVGKIITGEVRGSVKWMEEDGGEGWMDEKGGEGWIEEEEVEVEEAEEGWEKV